MQEEKLFCKLDIIALIASVFVISIHTSVDTFYAGYVDLSRSFDHCMLDFTNFVRVYLANFAVPYFFVRSGMLFFRNFSMRKYPSKLKSRFFSLVIPFVAWNLIAYLFDVAITTLPVISKMIYQRTVEPLTVNELYQIIVNYKYHPFNWFLSTLIVLVVISPIFWLFLQNKYLSAIGLVAVVVGAQYTPYITRYMILFYVGGLCGRYFYERLQEPIKLAMWVRVLILVGSFAAYILYGLERLMQGQVLIQLIEVWAIWLVADGFRDLDEKWWMKTSFFIYESQIILASCITKLIYVFLPRNAVMMSLNLILTMALTPMVANVIYRLLQKYCKVGLRILAGSR